MEKPIPIKDLTKNIFYFFDAFRSNNFCFSIFLNTENKLILPVTITEQEFSLMVGVVAGTLNDRNFGIYSFTKKIMDVSSIKIAYVYMYFWEKVKLPLSRIITKDEISDGTLTDVFDESKMSNFVMPHEAAMLSYLTQCPIIVDTKSMDKITCQLLPNMPPKDAIDIIMKNVIEKEKEENFWR